MRWNIEVGVTIHQRRYILSIARPDGTREAVTIRIYRGISKNPLEQHSPMSLSTCENVSGVDDEVRIVIVVALILGPDIRVCEACSAQIGDKVWLG